MHEKRIIVISAINFTEGGPLTILKNCLGFLDHFLNNHDNYRVIAFVHSKELFPYSTIDFVEIKKSKNSWLYRLYIEYFYFKKYSKEIKPYLWLSLHDMSPNVMAYKRVVYCHNPTPFYQPRLKDIYFNYKVFLFSVFYKYLYKINIKKNNFVIVQQNWLRDSFHELYRIPLEKIVVALPVEKNTEGESSIAENINKDKVFFYPAFPRPFKNFEIICEAVKKIQDKGITNFQVFLTIDGTENNYSKHIMKKYGNLTNINFTGILGKQKVLKLYEEADALIFPSKLETWGLPVSEFLKYKKPMILADLPYAHETSQGADKVIFFNPSKAEELALIMENLINNNLDDFKEMSRKKIDQPFANNWQELFEIILK